jgi:hypothetical protein
MLDGPSHTATKRRLREAMLGDIHRGIAVEFATYRPA